MNEIVRKIRKKQEELTTMINTAFDEIIKEVERISDYEVEENNNYDTTYPLTNAAGLKGKKIIAVIINEERYISPTWKNAVKIILDDVIKDNVKKKKLFSLREKILGRKRVILSSKLDDMRSPLELANNLYIETHYDTETLVKLLLQILNQIDYDYSNIKIVIKN